MEGEDKRERTGEKGIYTIFLGGREKHRPSSIPNKFIVPELRLLGSELDREGGHSSLRPIYKVTLAACVPRRAAGDWRNAQGATSQMRGPDISAALIQRLSVKGFQGSDDDEHVVWGWTWKSFSLVRMTVGTADRHHGQCSDNIVVTSVRRTGAA